MTHPAAKHLKEIRNERFYRVFDDWLELMIAAHTRDEDNYMKTMRRYGPRETGKEHPADHFKAAIWAVMAEMQRDNEKGDLRDHLGEIYEQEAAQNTEMGQFFTPMSVCKVMTAMTIGDGLPDKEHVNINDPACGSGRLLLAAMPHFKLGQATYYGTDLDRTCAMMAAMNMLWRNADSYIVWGNSLTVEARGGWMTEFTGLGGRIRAMTQEQAQSVIEIGLRGAAEEPQHVLGTPEKKEEIQKVAEEIKIRENKRGQFEMEL